MLTIGPFRSRGEILDTGMWQLVIFGLFSRLRIRCLFFLNLDQVFYICIALCIDTNDRVNDNLVFYQLICWLVGGTPGKMMDCHNFK